MLRLLLALVVTALVAISSAAGAQSDDERATARSLANQAQAAFDNGEHASAIDLFQRADAVVPAPTFRFGIALAQIGLGQWLAARQELIRIIKQGAPEDAHEVWHRTIAEARLAHEQLNGRIPQVTLMLVGGPTPSEVTVTLDGSALADSASADSAFANRAMVKAMPLDPGPHVVVAKAAGYRKHELRFVAEERGRQTVELRLSPIAPAVVPASVPPPLPGAPQSADGAIHVHRSVGFTLLGFGTGALAVGAIFGGLALDAEADLDARCPNAVCDVSQRSKLDALGGLRTVTTVGFVAAATGVGAGVGILAGTSADERTTVNALGWSLLGLAGASLAAGIATGALALNTANPAACASGACSTAEQDKRDEHLVWRSFAIGSLVTAGVGAAAGGTMVLLADEPAAVTSIQPYLSPTSFGIRGAF